MTVNELEIEFDQAIAVPPLKGASHAAEAVLARKCPAAIGEAIAPAAAGEIAEQCACVLVGDAEPINIEDRVVHSGMDRGVAEIVHVWKKMYMRLGVDALPGQTQLRKTIRPEACEQEQTILAQHSTDFGKHGATISHPRQQLIAEDDVDTLIGQWNGTRGRLQQRDLREPGLLATHLLQHVRRLVDGNDVCTTKLPGQWFTCGTRCAAKVDDSFCVDQHRFESGHQACTRNSMHEVKIVKAVGCLIESAADVVIAKGHQRTLPALCPVRAVSAAV